MEFPIRPGARSCIHSDDAMLIDDKKERFSNFSYVGMCTEILPPVRCPQKSPSHKREQSEYLLGTLQLYHREMEEKGRQYYQIPRTAASIVSSWVPLDYYQQEEKETRDYPSTGTSPLDDQYQEQLLSAASATRRHSTSPTAPPFSTVRVTETATILVTVTIHRDGGNGHHTSSHSSLRQSVTTSPSSTTVTTVVPVFHKDHSISHGGDVQPLSNTAPPVKGPMSQTISLISASGGAFLGTMGSIGENPQPFDKM